MSFFRRVSERRKKATSNVAQKGRSSAPQTPTAGAPGFNPRSQKPNGAPDFNTEGSKGAYSDGLLLIEEHHPGDLGMGRGEEYKKESKLCRSLHEIIHDHEAVPYLIQYLESCKSSSLIRFWLDSESFQASTWTRIRTHSLQSVSKSSLIKDKVPVSPAVSLTQSVNKDITSPMSGSSVDCVTSPAAKSQSSEALSSTVILDQKNSIHSNDTDCDISNKHNPNPGLVSNLSQETSSDTLTARNTSVSKSNSKDASQAEAEGNSEQCLSVDSCDSRVREKCKVSTDRQSLSLPLSNPDCDNNRVAESNSMKADQTVHTDSAIVANQTVNTDSAVVANQTVNTESAISYRDIASPSPTESCASEAEASQKSAGTSKPVTPSSTSTNLADKLKKSVEQDAVRIFTKYLAQEATHPIGVSDDLRNNTIRKICREDGQVDPECFMECQKFAINKMQEKYFDGFKRSVSHCKYQVEVATGGKLHINDVLYHDNALFYFMEYIEQEGLSHLLHFVIASDNFEHMLDIQESYDGLQAQEDAMVLYDKYFSLQAMVPLGFPDSIRIELEGNICREAGPLPDCFNKPRHIILHTLDKRCFQQYLTSDVYYKYLSELVSAVQNAQDYPLGQQHRHKRTNSDTSSEHSVGTQSVGSQSVGSESVSSRNTLLASGSSKHLQLSKLEENMKDLALDEALINPDKLWERPQSGRMTLGKIDSLGQFVSHFVPDPEATGLVKKQATAPRFFKSKKDKEKEQEDMARKVAERILSDVTSVTQAIGAMKQPSAISDGTKQFIAISDGTKLPHAVSASSAKQSAAISGGQAKSVAVSDRKAEAPS